MRNNKISTKTCFNPFTKSNYYIIEVDGMSLEKIVLDKCNEDITPGLVPTLLNWLSDLEEREVVWSRTLPEEKKKANLPILMCSEDIDLWCTLIIAEVEVDKDYVYWNKFGLEVSDAETPQEIGKEVKWYKDIPPMIFSRKEYEELLNRFKIYLDDSKSDEYVAQPFENVQIQEY